MAVAPPYDRLMSSKLLLVVSMIALLGLGCSETTEPSTTSMQQEAAGGLMVWNGGEIGIVEEAEITGIESSGSISQVTPAASGALVWTAVDGEPSRVSAVIDDGERIELDTPTVPFFYAWDPTGSRVAFLGNAAADGLIFGVIEVASEVVTPLETPAPFFFDWSPDGERLIAHVAGTSLGIIDAASGEVEDIGEESGSFPAPVWVDEGIVIAIRLGPTVSGALTPVVFQQASSSVVLMDPDDLTTVELASIDGQVRMFPGSDRLALVVGGPGVQRIDVVDWSGSAIATVGGGTIDLVQWSPDGTTLLWTERGDGDLLEPKTWSGGEPTEYPEFRPSGVFAAAYLPFWDQYDRAISLWSSDSASFALPTRTADEAVIRVHSLDGTSVEHRGWEMAAWIPGSGAG